MASFPSATSVRLAAIGLLAATALILLTLQFIPTHAWHINGGADEGGVQGTAGLWGFHEREGTLGHDSRGWFDDWKNDEGVTRDGVEALRAAAILGTTGLITALGATVLLLLDRRWAATGLAAAAGLCSILAINLNGSGMMAFAFVHVDRAFGYGLGVLGGFTAVIGTVLATLPSPTLGIQNGLQAWAGGEPVAKPAKPAPKAKSTPTPAPAPGGGPNLRVGSAIALALAVLLLGVAQFTPWSAISGATGDVSGSVQARTWELVVSGTSGSVSGTQSVNWFDADMDGEEGIGLIRAGAPLLALGLTGLLVGAALTTLDRAREGAIFGVIGVASTILASILLATGTDEVLSHGGSAGAALWLAVIGILSGAMGAFGALLPAREIALKERLAASE